MYYWKKLTDEQREEILRIRRGRGFPWHSPPHFDFTGPVTFLISATCYHHQPIVGKSVARMSECEFELLELCGRVDAKVFAWCILPNHYHILVRTDRIKALRKEIGRFHGRTSFRWNQEDGRRGRKTWYNFLDKAMKSSRHFWASINYVHNNPLKHGYVKKWQDWPFSSATRYLDGFGRRKAEFIWKKYPVLDYGEGWDD